ncbi:MAG: hypothetical protein ACOC9T_03020 [Myxococcota bacterium]
MAKPSEVPTWATDDNYDSPGNDWDGEPTKVDPGSALKEGGWEPAQRVPAEYINWLFNRIGQWLDYIDELGDLHVTYSLADATYTGRRYETDSEGRVLAVEFKPDGTRMYAWIRPSGDDDRIQEYDLSTPWDVRTASPTANNFVYGDASHSFAGLRFKDDGAKVLFLRAGDAKGSVEVQEFTLTTPWDLTSATDLETLDVSSQIPTGGSWEFLAFDVSRDGTKLYAGDDFSGTVYQYTMSTPWDLTTASYDGSGSDLDLSSHGGLQSIGVHPEGRALFALIQGDDVVLEYVLEQQWDIASAVHAGRQLDLSGLPEDDKVGMGFSSTGGTWYLAHNDGADDGVIREMSLGRVTFR